MPCRPRLLRPLRLPFRHGGKLEPRRLGVNGGIRTHADQGHDLALYPLSYVHHAAPEGAVGLVRFERTTPRSRSACANQTAPQTVSQRRKEVPLEGLEPPTVTFEACRSIR
jgi:hypothetical protein